VVRLTVKTAKVTVRRSMLLSIGFSDASITRVVACYGNIPQVPCTYNRRVYTEVGQWFHLLTRLIH